MYALVTKHETERRVCDNSVAIIRMYESEHGYFPEEEKIVPLDCVLRHIT